MKSRIGLSILLAATVGSVGLGSTALASSPSNSQLITEGNCKFDLYHTHSSSGAHADTENKGGCSEVAARIHYNSTNTGWSYATSKANVNISLTPFTFVSSSGKGYETGVGYHSTWWLVG